MLNWMSDESDDTNVATKHSCALIQTFSEWEMVRHDNTCWDYDNNYNCECIILWSCLSGVTWFTPSLSSCMKHYIICWSMAILTNKRN